MICSRGSSTAPPIPRPRAQSILNLHNGLLGRRRSGGLEDAQPVLPQPPRGAATARHQALLAFDAPGKRPGPHVAGDVLSANRAIAGSETVSDSEHAVARKVSRHVGGRRIAWATRSIPADHVAEGDRCHGSVHAPPVPPAARHFIASGGSQAFEGRRTW